MKKTHALPHRPTTLILTSPSKLSQQVSQEEMKLDDQGTAESIHVYLLPIDIDIRNRALFVGVVICTSALGYEGNWSAIDAKREPLTLYIKGHPRSGPVWAT